MSRIRAALVGCGAHARMGVLPAVRQAPVELVAVCDLDPGTAEACARDFGAGAALTDYDQLLRRDDLEAVFIVTPFSTHADLTVRALKAGLHVFVEKPPATDPAGAEEIRRVALETGRSVMVGFNKRFAPCYLAARAAQTGRGFGRTLAVRVKYVSGATYPDRRAFAYDFAVHALDLLEFFGGQVERPVFSEVSGEGNRWLWSLTAGGARGAILTAIMSSSGSWGDPGEEVEIFGEGQSVRCENLVRVTHYRGSEPCWTRLPGLDAGTDSLRWEPNLLVPNTMNEAVHLQGYLREIRHFAQSLLLEMPPSPGPDEGLRAVRLAEAMTTGGM